jgi:Ni/Co efflux regulator RcnB
LKNANGSTDTDSSYFLYSHYKQYQSKPFYSWFLLDSLNLASDQDKKEYTMKKPIVLVLSTLMLGMSATAMADSNHRWDNYHGKDHNRYEQRHDYRYDHRNDHRAPVWSHSERGNHYGRYVAFKRGDRIPVEYRNSRYYVSDWRTSFICTTTWIPLGEDS